MTALHALNHLENGGAVLVSLPGCISSVFRLTPAGFQSYNVEIGPCCDGKTAGEIYKHFANIIKDGGEITEIEI